MVTLFSEKMLTPTPCICGLMPNSNKKILDGIYFPSLSKKRMFLMESILIFLKARLDLRKSWDWHEISRDIHWCTVHSYICGEIIYERGSCLNPRWRRSQSLRFAFHCVYKYEFQKSINLFVFRAARANFWQAMPSLWQPHQQRAAATLYSAKSWQGPGLRNTRFNRQCNGFRGIADNSRQV